MAGFSKIAVVVKGYPRLSETFIAQEIRGLEKRGLELNLFSLRHPTDPHIHPIHREIRSPVTYLPEYLHQHPLRIAKAATSAKSLPGFRRALEVFQKDFSRDRTRNRIRRFGQACVLAIEMNAATDCLYAHFLHTPASVARYAAIMRDLPLHLSGHAVDIWTSPDWELTEKMKDARWTSVCSEAGAQRLRALSETPENVIRLYHGLDLNRFPPITHEKPHRSGNQKSDPVHLLSVGRAVPKKGFPVMLDALALLPESLNWRWEHIGDGDQLEALKRQAIRLNLSNSIHWRGALPQQHVLESMRQADIFALPCVPDENGNQDGLPNVLLEAQSQRLPVIATNFAAIPELVSDGQTGLLVTPGDAHTLQKALIRLISKPKLRDTLGAAGEKRVRQHFAADVSLDRLADRFLKNNVTQAA